MSDETEAMVAKTLECISGEGASNRQQPQDFNNYREKKNRQWNFEVNKTKEIEEQAPSMEAVLARHSVLKNNDKLIQDSLEQQKEAMKKKLKERRERSFHRSMNKPEGKSIGKEEEASPGDASSSSILKAQKKGDSQTGDIDDENPEILKELTHNILALLDDIGDMGGSSSGKKDQNPSETPNKSDSRPPKPPSPAH